jgi:hypothetical protein
MSENLNEGLREQLLGDANSLEIADSGSPFGVQFIGEDVVRLVKLLRDAAAALPSGAGGSAPPQEAPRAEVASLKAENEGILKAFHVERGSASLARAHQMQAEREQALADTHAELLQDRLTALDGALKAKAEELRAVEQELAVERTRIWDAVIAVDAIEHRYSIENSGELCERIERIGKRIEGMEREHAGEIVELVREKASAIGLTQIDCPLCGAAVRQMQRAQRLCGHYFRIDI